MENILCVTCFRNAHRHFGVFVKLFNLAVEILLQQSYLKLLQLNFVYPTTFTIIDLLIVALALFHVKQFKYGCHDAMIEQKSENLVQILQYQVGAVTNLPPYKNLVPRFLSVREELGILLTKTRLSFPCCFGFRMVRPLNLEELDGLISGLPFRFIKDANRMLARSKIFLDVQCFMVNPTNRILEAATKL